MPAEHDLAEKLRKLEALFARPGTDGERLAAGAAIDRLRARLRELERTEPPQEFRFKLPDQWARVLFLALARRYGLEPYRLRGQRANTVMLRGCRTFVDGTLWPEFCELHAVLVRYLDEVTRRVIAEAVHQDTTEAGERAAAASTGVGGPRARGASA
ncbi:MAG TPA: hypothetical protein VFY71_16850 [Planctomycetota bacterium]|nr:hypothetical protein [Planctomycetota bacterium]